MSLSHSPCPDEGSAVAPKAQCSLGIRTEPPSPGRGRQPLDYAASSRRPPREPRTSPVAPNASEPLRKPHGLRPADRMGPLARPSGGRFRPGGHAATRWSRLRSAAPSGPQLRVYWERVMVAHPPAAGTDAAHEQKVEPMAPEARAAVRRTLSGARPFSESGWTAAYHP